MSVALASGAGAPAPPGAGDLDSVLDDLVASNRVLAREGVLDGFGHVSARNPHDAKRYFISRSRSPALVERADLVELDLDDRPVRPTDAKLYAERVIHGAIYKARPDVMSICHNHAPPVVAFCVAGIDMAPVCHLGAVIGQRVPNWDSRDEFGDTDLLVNTPEQAASLAATLADNWVAAMRRHGATVVGRSVRELTFRAVHLRLNAELQLQAIQMGPLSPLTAGEIELSSRTNLSDAVVGRIWEYWAAQV